MRFGDYEPLVEDSRLLAVESILRLEFPLLSPSARLVTFIQPPTEAQGLPIPAKANFAVVEANPRHPKFDLMTVATMNLEDWIAEDYEFRHFAGKSDPVRKFFRIIVREQVRKILDLKAMN
jgi:hypothetical protein